MEGDCLLWRTCAIISSKYQSQLLKELHKEHPGCSQTKSLARSYMWWPGMDRDIENTVKSCMSCQSYKNAPPPAPMHGPQNLGNASILILQDPFSFLVVVDAHFKWPEILNMTTIPLFTPHLTPVLFQHLDSAGIKSSALLLVVSSLPVPNLHCP